MKSGAGALLVALGIFIIYLGASGKMKYLGDAWDTLLGKTKAAGVADATPTSAPNTGFPVTPGVINSITSLFEGSAGASAATATTPGAAAAASGPAIFAAMA